MCTNTLFSLTILRTVLKSLTAKFSLLYVEFICQNKLGLYEGKSEEYEIKITGDVSHGLDISSLC